VVLEVNCYLGHVKKCNVNVNIALYSPSISANSTMGEAILFGASWAPRTLRFAGHGACPRLQATARAAATAEVTVTGAALSRLPKGKILSL